jgi:hypothetical protein
MLSFSISFSAFTQDALIMGGKMKLEEGKLDGKLEILENGNRVRIVSMSGNGKFEHKLDMNKEYIFSFSQEGYVSKKIAVNTNIPKDRPADPYPFIFDFQVTLFKQYEGVSFVVFNQPVGMIHFDVEKDVFDYDTDYTKSIQERLDEVAKEVEEKKIEEANKPKEPKVVLKDPPEREGPKQEKVEEKKDPPVIKEEVAVKREDPPTTPRKKFAPAPPPPPKKKGENVVVLKAYTVGEMGYPNLNAYGFINFGDGGGIREITKEQFDEYAKQYR